MKNELSEMDEIGEGQEELSRKTSAACYCTERTCMREDQKNNLIEQDLKGDGSS